MKIGVDFGTTHTSAAVSDGQSVQFIPLDLNNNDSSLLRSMLYIRRDHSVLLGREAVETYLREDTGRIARYEEKLVGTIENTVAQIGRGPTEPDGPIHIIYDVVIAEDVSANGRLIQSVKTGLRDKEYRGTNIYEQFYELPELISLILTHVRKRASAHLGQEIDEVVLGRPVAFTSTVDGDQAAEDNLRAAAKLAGFKKVSFEKEPIAAALFYTLNVKEPERVVVFDFGGGTLDMTVMDVQPDQPPQIRATQGVLVGGDDLDSALMVGRVSPYFGTTSSIDRDGAPFPQQLANLLMRWQTIPQLSRAEPLSVIRGAKQYGNNPIGFAALETLVKHNYGFSLFEHIEQAKRQLSEQTETNISMQVNDTIDLQMLITRREFQSVITEQIAAVQKGLTQVINSAEIDPADVQTVVTTGGSSLIPIFRLILERKFPNARLIQSNTFGSVTAGLALRAAE